MAREILFKAKRIDNGEWVMGGSIIQFLDDGVRSFYVPQFNEKCICEHDEVTDDILSFSNCRFYKVDGNTLCQYTGLTDKNGNKIWENDVLEWTRQDIVLTSSPYHEGYRLGDRVKVKKLDSGFTLLALKNNSDIPNIVGNVKNYEFWNMQRFLEVIGNIFDNPELVEMGCE